jgi:nicotinamide mononucleotide transporter
VSNIEIIAAVCGFFAVALTIRRNVWCWPVGLIQVSLYVWVFFAAKLYSDMLLHVVYVGFQFYGWAQWRGAPAEQAPDAPVQVETLPMHQWWLSLGMCGLLTCAIGLPMAAFTDAQWPMADAFVAGTSLVAQWLLARRKLENWYLWIVVDVVALGIFSAKGLWPTAVLYGLFLGMAIAGAIVWRRRAGLGDWRRSSTCSEQVAS